MGENLVLNLIGFDFPRHGDHDLEFVEIGFTAKLAEGGPSRLPPFLGATLRGAFGYLLKQTVCQAWGTPCDRCLLQRACPYPNVFEGIAPTGRQIMRNYPRVPQPFVLVVGGPGERGEEGEEVLNWSIRLFGSAAAYWPYVVHVFRAAGERGIGAKAIAYTLTNIRDEIAGESLQHAACSFKEPLRGRVRDQASTPAEARLAWRFRTPVRLARNGRLLSKSGFDPLALILAGRRRLQTLLTFYGSCNDAEDPTPLSQYLAVEDFVVVENSLRNWGFSRYSGRQRRRMDLEGLVGEVVIEGPWDRVGAWLFAAPTIHVGKSSSFGFGRVEWKAA